MSSRSLATARARRAGDAAPPISGNRPGTSIASHSAFANQPNNVRVARSMQQPNMQQHNNQMQMPNQRNPNMTQNQYNQMQTEQFAQQNNLPFSKLSISDAIGLITLRLGRVEQWIIETDHEDNEKPQMTGEGVSLPDNHKIIDNSVLTTIVNRLDSLEKNTGTGSGSSDEINKLNIELTSLKEQLSRIGDTVNRHNIELAKNTEQVFKFNRDLVETKDLLKSFMIKYDLFTEETNNKFSDYEFALSEIEKNIQPSSTNIDDIVPNDEGTSLSDINVDLNNSIMTVDLKNIIKQELANS